MMDVPDWFKPMPRWRRKWLDPWPGEPSEFPPVSQPKKEALTAAVEAVGRFPGSQNAMRESLEAEILLLAARYRYWDRRRRVEIGCFQEFENVVNAAKKLSDKLDTLPTGLIHTLNGFYSGHPSVFDELTGNKIRIIFKKFKSGDGKKWSNVLNRWYGDPLDRLCLYAILLKNGYNEQMEKSDRAPKTRDGELIQALVALSHGKSVKKTTKGNFLEPRILVDSMISGSRLPGIRRFLRDTAKQAQGDGLTQTYRENRK